MGEAGKVACKRSGFTLIELLVVVAIVAILAAVLAPMYLTAKANALTATCQNHEKQILAALAAYTDDYGGKLPWLAFTMYADYGGNIPGHPETHRVRLYYAYLKSFNILLCPTGDSYGYNRNLCGPLGKRAWIPGGIASRCEVYRDAAYAGRMLSEIPRPGRVMAFLCAARGPDPMSGGADGLGPNGWEWEPHDVGEGYSQRLTNRHRGGTVYAFLDGHVRWLVPTGTKYGFRIATDGIDYDGNGTVGTVDFMR